MKSRNLFLSSAVLLSILFVGCAGTSSSSSIESSSSGDSTSEKTTAENLELLKKNVNTKIDSDLTSLRAYQTVYDMYTTGLYGGVYTNEEGQSGIAYCYQQDSITSTELNYNVYDNDVLKYSSKSYQESLLYNTYKDTFPEEKLISNYEITEFYEGDKMFVTMEDKYNPKNSESGATKIRKDSLVGQGYKTFKAQADYVLNQGKVSVPNLNEQFLQYASEKYVSAKEYELEVVIDGDGEVGDTVDVTLTTVEESKLYDLYENIGTYYSDYFFNSTIDIETSIEASFDITEDGYVINYMTVEDAYHVMEDPYKANGTIDYEHTGEDVSSKGYYLYITEVLYDVIGFGENGKQGEKTKVDPIDGLSEKIEKINEIGENSATIDASATKGVSTSTTNHYLINVLYNGEEVLFEQSYGHPITEYRGSRTLTSTSIHYADGYVVTSANDNRDHYSFAADSEGSYSLSNGTIPSDIYSYESTLHADSEGNIIASMTSPDKEDLNLEDYTLYSYSTLSSYDYTAEEYLATIIGCNGLLYNYLNTYYVSMPDSSCEFTTNDDGTTTVTMNSSYYTTYAVCAEALEDTSTDYYDAFILDPLCQVKIALTATLDAEGKVTSFDVTRTYYALESYSCATLSEPLQFGTTHFQETITYDAVGNYKSTEATNA